MLVVAGAACVSALAGAAQESASPLTSPSAAAPGAQPAPNEPDVPNPEAGAGAYTSALATGWLREVAPMVEAASGRTFAAQPRLELVPLAALERDVRSGLELRADLRYPETTPGEAGAAEEAARLAPNVLAAYSLVDRTLRLAPGNASRVFGLHDYGPDTIAVVMKLTLAYELTRALQDQQVLLTGVLERLTTPESLAAFEAVSGGYALLIMRDVARRIDAPDSALDFAERALTGGILPDGASDELREAADQRLERLQTGAALVQARRAAAGDAAIWDLIAHPPESMDGLRSLASGEAPAPTAQGDAATLFAALEGVEDTIDDRAWTIRSLELSRSALGASLTRLQPQERDAILGSVRRAVARAAVDAPGRAQVIVSVYRFDTPERPAAYADAVERAMRQTLQSLIERGSDGVELMKREEIEVPGAQLARWIEFDLVEPDAKRHQVIFRVARDGTLVELIASNVELGQEKAIEAVEAVFRRLAP